MRPITVHGRCNIVQYLGQRATAEINASLSFLVIQM